MPQTKRKPKAAGKHYSFDELGRSVITRIAQSRPNKRARQSDAQPISQGTSQQPAVLDADGGYYDSDGSPGADQDWCDTSDSVPPAGTQQHATVGYAYLLAQHVQGSWQPLKTAAVQRQAEDCLPYCKEDGSLDCEKYAILGIRNTKLGQEEHLTWWCDCSGRLMP